MKPIFEITNLEGKSLKIFEDGKVEGAEHLNFEKRMIINRIPIFIINLEKSYQEKLNANTSS